MKLNRFGFSKKKMVVEIIKVMLLTGGIGYLFFDSVPGFFLALPMGLAMFYQDGKDSRLKYTNRIKEEFKEIIVATSGALGAGYSLEKSFVLAVYDVKQLYPNGYILEKEMLKFQRGLDIKKTIEEVFCDFAKGVGIEEIEDFAKVLIILKRNGGNTIKIIRETSENLATKIEVEKEIETMVAAKRLEHKIMCIMPFAIIAYMRITNGTYMNNFYHNIGGIIVGAVAIVIICIAFIVGNKMVEIKI